MQGSWRPLAIFGIERFFVLWFLPLGLILQSACRFYRSHPLARDGPDLFRLVERHPAAFLARPHSWGCVTIIPVVLKEALCLEISARWNSS